MSYESQSYEDWMNHMATDDSKPKRGWTACHQDRCDRCGCFVRRQGPGVSWSRQWSYDTGGTPDLHDETYRCSRCTDKHGIHPTNCIGDGYNGRNPQGETA